MPRTTEVVWRPVAALVGGESGVLGLDDHILEQGVEVVGCLGVEFVIVSSRGPGNKLGLETGDG